MIFLVILFTRKKKRKEKIHKLNFTESNAYIFQNFSTLSYIVGKRSDIHPMPFEPLPKNRGYSHGILTRDFHFPAINQNVVDSMSREHRPTFSDLASNPFSFVEKVNNDR